jgi:hypothetical protein
MEAELASIRRRSLEIHRLLAEQQQRINGLSTTTPCDATWPTITRRDQKLQVLALRLDTMRWQSAIQYRRLVELRIANTEIKRQITSIQYK